MTQITGSGSGSEPDSGLVQKLEGKKLTVGFDPQ